MYHPGKIVRCRLNAVDYYQYVLDLLPPTGETSQEFPDDIWQVIEDWTEAQNRGRMFHVFNRGSHQLWGTNDELYQYDLFLDTIRYGTMRYATDTRPELDWQIRFSLRRLLDYLRGHDLEYEAMDE